MSKPHEPHLSDKGDPIWYRVTGPNQSHGCSSPETMIVNLCRHCGALYADYPGCGNVCPARDQQTATAPGLASSEPASGESAHPWGIPRSDD